MLYLYLPVGAQDQVTYYDPISEISLNIKELTMQVGDQINLPVTYIPAETPNVFLNWYTDEKTIRIDLETLTVTALSAGKTRLLVESSFGFAWDYCDITVIGSGSKNVSEKEAGTELISLSEADRSKIKAETFLRYLDFINNSRFIPEKFNELSERSFNVTAIVEPGCVSGQSQLAASLGMKKALALPDFNAVSMYGSLIQILTFLKNNDDLVSLIEFSPIFIEDPDEDEDLSAKGMNLKDNVEALTSVSTAHDLGLKGDGTVIAIIDSGLNKEHEQFKDRVIAEYCASYTDEDGYSTCLQGSSEPSKARNKAEFNHGSHTAGIAAGRDGIAPHASIISINNSCEVCVENECFRIIVFDMLEVSQYLIDLQKEYKAAGKPQIVAVNMSFGKSQGFPGACDEDYEPYPEAFDLLLKNDMIPVTASGNNGYFESIPAYGCISNAFTVGALTDNPSPMIRSSSNHGLLVDILAPGTKIWSALYADDGKDTSTCSGINCYGFKNGTSMAAPMVSGAFAILKQANPNLTVSQMESQIKGMSTKTANYRPASKNVPEHTFPYDIPVLDFSDIEKYVAPVPEPDHKPVFWPLDLPVLPRTGFSAKNLQIMDAVPKDVRYEPMGLILEIPVLDVQTEIVKVPVWKGEFAVIWLGDSVGLLEGSARPGNGTAVLAAHNHLNTKEAGPFAFLSCLEEGERIFIRDAQNDLQTYSVYANEKIAETDFEALEKIAEAFDNSLIMITCEDEMISGGYHNRRVVAAKKIN